MVLSAVGRKPIRAIILWVTLAALSGALVGGGSSRAQLAVVGAWAVLLFALLCPTEIIIALIMVGVFVTRPKLPLAHFGLRLDDVLSVALLVRLAWTGHSRRVATTLVSKQTLWLSLFILWLFITSLVNAPNVSSSMTIVGWLTLDLVLFVGLRAADPDPRILMKWGLVGVAANALAAVALWVGAVAFNSHLGIQTDPTYGGPASFVLSYEANILAIFLVLFALAVYLQPARVKLSWKSVAVLALVVAALPITHTRSAIIGLALGVLVFWLSSRGRLPRRLAPAMIIGTMLLLASLVVLPSATQNAFAKAGKLADFSSGTGLYRTSNWAVAIQDLSGPAAYVGGLGENSFGQRHTDPSRPTQDVPAYLGNFPLQLLYDGGILGTLLFVAFLASMRPRGPLARRWLVIGFAYLIMASATSPFWFAGTWVLFAWMSVEGRRIYASGYSPLYPASDGLVHGGLAGASARGLRRNLVSMPIGDIGHP